MVLIEVVDVVGLCQCLIPADVLSGRLQTNEDAANYDPHANDVGVKELEYI